MDTKVILKIINQLLKLISVEESRGLSLVWKNECLKLKYISEKIRGEKELLKRYPGK